MKQAAIALLLSVAAAFAQTAPSQDTVRLAQAVAAETIPRFTIKDATFEEALAVVRNAWSERHPNDPLPVVITDYQPPKGGRETDPAKITLDLKNIPFIEALRYIGALSGRRMKSINGLVQLERISWIEEDWVTRVHEISPAALDAFRPKPGLPGNDVRQTFQHYGVKFEDWMKIGIANSGKEMWVLSYQEQQEQIAGILFLLGNGFKITK